MPEAQGSPNVYLPQNVPPTRYDGYADPASAHGWESAYDETRELPPVGERDVPSVTGAVARATVRAAGPSPGGRGARWPWPEWWARCRWRR
ncbi:hypothetical protein [Streptomyces coelicoflavus]|uniref:hypothetical protein n=1 Tax=Streptomyces coelicoflavus TaxID=285562 RepID=UPI00331F3518